jgi:predicted XRE-type DNA-binding protein
VQEYLHPFSEFFDESFTDHLIDRRLHESRADRFPLSSTLAAARGASFAADQDEGPQRGSGRPIPPLVSNQATTTNARARPQGGLTPDFLAPSNSMATTVYLRVSTGTQAAILLQKQVSKASIAKIVGVTRPTIYRFIKKAVTPTSLKDIFTPIWSNPLNEICPRD